MEEMFKYNTIEQARNAAIKWLEDRDVQFGPHRKIVIGRLGDMKGKEAGTESSADPYWRIRLDYDLFKGPHFNVESGKGKGREKAAFCFNGDRQLILSLAKKRGHR